VAESPDTAQPSPGILAGRRVLLADDESLLVMVMEEVLQEFGCEVLGPAATVEEALCLSRSEAGRIDAAVLDVNLAGRPSFPVADLLAGAGVPVAFVTGYRDLPDGRAVGDANVLLQKPLRRGELEAALSRMMAARPRGAAAFPENARSGTAA
jgi:CheY-like chemotaxis protein